ncbi:AN1-type zinc finger protein 2A [Topomyia yanbarensis]|uniref:AN1-type zinc finger protein 2A n=1 Tax=Topomyia yanbarensis TaxID=2498891 RepID=UPI00273B5003|nr:AN1-type zinc finger protein 2A [Topomyia yanbarensis]
MEFPSLGKHCCEKFCNKLDFLPMKCDACGDIFCSDHFSYRTHSCPSAYKKDVQVPICPLCGEPVPTARDVSPDVTVGAHIDQFCKSEKKKIYTNRCSYKTCKKKELIPVSCGVCKRNYCLKHRHTSDHECAGAQSASVPQRSLVAQAALDRQRQQNQKSIERVPNRPAVASIHLEAVQGNMSEDEALARALALSLQEEDDERARAARDNGSGSGGASGRNGIAVGGTSAKDKCNLS